MAKHRYFAPAFLFMILRVFSNSQTLIHKQQEEMCQCDLAKEVNDKLRFHENKLNSLEKVLTGRLDKLDNAVKALEGGIDKTAFVNADANLARNKVTSQSTLYLNNSDFGSNKAVDGLALDICGNCITQTHSAQGDYKPWWMVDLGKSYTIEHVMFLGKSSRMVNRLHDITINVGETPTNLNKRCGFYKGPPQQREWVKVVCSTLTTGRFLKLSKPYSTYQPFLELCEVIVKGY